MALSLDKIKQAYDILKNYEGDNSYIIDLKNDVYAYKTMTLNDFHAEYILNNHDKEPIFIYVHNGPFTFTSSLDMKEFA